MSETWMTESATMTHEWYGAAEMWAEYALVRLANGLEPEMESGDRIAALRYLFAAGGALMADAYVYLCRRFGPSPCGYDEEKELGCWVFTTPDPSVMVVVRPKASMVGVSVIRPDGHSCEAPEVQVAVFAMLRDLLRPVRIRDQWRTIAGIWRPGADDIDEDTGKARNEAPSFAFAGRGCIWSGMR